MADIKEEVDSTADLVDDISDDSDDDDLQDEDITQPIKITEDGGIMKQILVPGKGYEKPHAGADVSVHYVGTLEDGSKFDSSRDRDEPFEFKLGQGRVIKGWDKGVATMRKGEKAVFTIKSEYGYGASGSPPKIPPNATLIFEVELLSWIDFTDLTKDGGVLKKVLNSVDGWEKPKEDATVTVKYTLKTQDGKVVPGEENVEKTFVIGAEEVPTGLELGVKDMKKGERVHLTVKPNYAYGAQGNEAKKIAGNTTLVYDPLELVEFTKEKEAWEMNTTEKFAACERVKAEGNDLFKASKWERAKKKYKKALEFVDSEYSMEDEDKEKAKPLRLACYLNMAACELKTKEYKAVLENCKKALEIKQDVKALFRRAQAYNGLDEWDEAEAAFTAVLAVEPENKDAKRELALLARKKQAQDKKDRALYASMFKAVAAAPAEPAVVDRKGKGKA